MAGHVRKRGDRWQAIVSVTGSDGRRRQLSGTRSTRREAHELLTKLLLDSGQAGDLGNDETLGTLLDAWQRTKVSTWSPRTVRETRYILRSVPDELRARPLRKLRTIDLDLLYADLGQRVAPATVRRLHTALRSALTQAVRWEWIARNPATNATLPTLPPSEVRPPEPADVAKLITAAEEHDPDFAAWLHLAAAAGARRGELVALRWSDLDLDAGTVLFARALVEGPDGVVEKTTKTRKGRRLSLDAATVAVLRVHRARALERAMACGARLAPDAWVFTGDAAGRTPWRPELPSRRFIRLRRRLGLEVRLHDLRHFHATRLLVAGVDVATVAGRLGHSGGGRTTLAVYSHFLEQADRHAADVIGNVMREAR